LPISFVFEHYLHAYIFNTKRQLIPTIKMRFTIASIALAAGTASAAAQYGYGYEAPANTTSAVETPAYPASSDVYVTKTVSSYETYCPGPTEITTNSKTYTVTEATTLTITDCPCTVIETPTPEVPYPTETPEYPEETPEVPVPTSKVPEAPYPSANGTAPAPVYPTGTGAVPSPSESAPVEFPGAASNLGVSGALLAVGALAAFL
jgi:hypothetical protein